MTTPGIGLTILHESDTELGTLVLRKRFSMALERDVFEMTMDGQLMMSSAVVVSERALAQRAIAVLRSEGLRVLVGGLGFGFTALAALEDPRVGRLTVIERLDPVIEWHRAGVFPWSEELFNDPRLQLVTDDFFSFVERPTQPFARYDVILIDIDDSPNLLWHGSHAAFYKSSGLDAIQRRLHPGGVLGLWCATHPGDAFLNAAHATFAATTLVEIPFENPCLRQPETNFIFLATTRF